MIGNSKQITMDLKSLVYIKTTNRVELLIEALYIPEAYYSLLTKFWLPDAFGIYKHNNLCTLVNYNGIHKKLENKYSNDLFFFTGNICVRFQAATFITHWSRIIQTPPVLALQQFKASIIQQLSQIHMANKWGQVKRLSLQKKTLNLQHQHLKHTTIASLLKLLTSAGIEPIDNASHAMPAVCPIRVKIKHQRKYS